MAERTIKAMAKSVDGLRRSPKSRAIELFLRADGMRDQGKLRTAFHLFLEAAKAGDRGAQVNVGYCYDTGSGTRPNRRAALYWYKRAYRSGDASAAHDIGTIWRDEGKSGRALSWFRRAVKLGHDDSNLEIAKYYFRSERNSLKAIPYLKKVWQSDHAALASVEQAKRLLKTAKKRAQRGNRDYESSYQRQ